MTTAKPLARYGAMRARFASGFAPAELHHYRGHHRDERFRRSRHELKSNPRIAPAYLLDDGTNEGRGYEGSASDSDAAGTRDVKKLDGLHGLAQIIEQGRSTFEKRAP